MRINWAIFRTRGLAGVIAALTADTTTRTADTTTLTADRTLS